MPTTPAQPILTVNQPAANAVVGLNTPFQITGLVTDRAGAEPIMIDSVTAQVDSGPLIKATLTRIPNKNLVEVSFHASAQIPGGSDPHTVTIVATNDQGLHATKTVTVFTGVAFQVDTPALLLDLLTLIPITADDPQVLALIGKIQGQLGTLSATLASSGKVLIGPNLIVLPVNSAESRVRVGFWIENPGFPVVPPSAAFPLPRLSDAGAAACFVATPVLTVPGVGMFPSFALSIPTTTLQHLVDAILPTLKSQASSQGFAIDTVSVQTISPSTVNTNVTGHVVAGLIPASFTVSETVGLKPVAGGPSDETAPGVNSTDSSSSVGSIAEWILAAFVPLVGGILADAWYKVSTAASQKTGVAGSFLGSIPARIPFGSKTISLPPGGNFQFPDFPTLNFFWDSFQATSSGLLGNGTTEIDPRTEADVQVILRGPDSFVGFQNTIAEFTDPTMGYVLENISPDSGKFGWQISGAGSKAGTLEPPSPAVQAGDFFPHFPLPLKPSVGDYHFNLTINAVETCQSDPGKTLTGTASKAMLFRVKKSPESL